MVGPLVNDCLAVAEIPMCFYPVLLEMIVLPRSLLKTRRMLWPQV